MEPAVGAQQLVYGPVPSRRLGRSLGIDLVPLKTCTYDCIYCQLGRTTRQTVRRQRRVDPSDVVAQVRARLESEPDVIALAGSGEPTLHTGIGDVIAGIKRLTEVPVAVITNGSLLGRPAVRRGLAAADIVLPSLDAPDDGLFQLVNRPHGALRLDDVVGGMIAFRNGYRGQVWLEVMLLAGVTGIPAEVERLAEVAARIAPDRIQLNTAVRPPAESFVAPVADGSLREFAGLFTPHAEVIADTAPGGGDQVAGRKDILALLSRRPCTVADIAVGLGIHHGEALKAATALITEGAAELHPHEDRSFYVAATATAENRQKERS
jgi:wyosine [tRNA(Phe)-imidazoG37] synthetase (radical SAM superfamily)